MRADRIGIIANRCGGCRIDAALAFQLAEFSCDVYMRDVAIGLRSLESIPPCWQNQTQTLYEVIGDPSTRRAQPIAMSQLFPVDKSVRR